MWLSSLKNLQCDLPFSVYFSRDTLSRGSLTRMEGSILFRHCITSMKVSLWNPSRRNKFCLDTMSFSDELPGFEKAWMNDARRHLPGWEPGFMLNDGSAGLFIEANKENLGTFTECILEAYSSFELHIWR